MINELLYALPLNMCAEEKNNTTSARSFTAILAITIGTVKRLNKKRKGDKKSSKFAEW